MKENDLAQYLREIGRHALLTRDEETQVARRIHNAALDDRERRRARERLIVCNLRLVVSVAKEYARHGASLHELIAEGNIGLLKAVARFDPERGFRFSTYATYWIRQSVQLAARAQRKTSRSGAEGRPAAAPPPDVDRYLSEETRESLGPFFGARPPRRTISLDELLRSRQVEGPGDPVLDSTVDLEKLQSVLKVLDRRESEIVRLRFGLEEATSPLTLGEIGDRLGITRERVRQIEDRAIQKLQREFRRTGT
jgi:RNA polymerase sigma factor (sigma-70 family)